MFLLVWSLVLGFRYTIVLLFLTLIYHVIAHHVLEKKQAPKNLNTYLQNCTFIP